jgi:hypothetical protein
MNYVTHTNPSLQELRWGSGHLVCDALSLSLCFQTFRIYFFLDASVFKDDSTTFIGNVEEHPTTQRLIPEDLNPQQQRSFENLKHIKIWAYSSVGEEEQSKSSSGSARPSP